ncbi:hypothetical protein ABTE85_22700, partial [Acinetobacter baumannii]
MGGQIQRHPPAQLVLPHWLTGATYDDLKAQLHRTEALDGLDWRGGISVLGLFRQADGFQLLATDRDGRMTIAARRVL